MTRPNSGENGRPRSPYTTDASYEDPEDAQEITALTQVGLPDEVKRLLLHVARQTLDTYLGSGERPRFAYDSPALSRPRAVFVTLWRRDTEELRGCRGESMAHRPLIEAVPAMAIASAVDDPRFFPVTHAELPHLRIEINALTPLAIIRPEEVEVSRHGLMIVCGMRAGLLLPDVPVRFGWDREQFLQGLCQKASLPRNAWQESGAQLFGFESEEWGEE